MSYNGWKNYSTWNVCLWIGNDESAYERMRAVMKRHPGRLTSVVAYEACVQALGDSRTPDGVDMLGENGEGGKVYWPEIIAWLRENR